MISKYFGSIEGLVEAHVLYRMLWRASQFTPITIDNGRFFIHGEATGSEGQLVTLEILEDAIERALSCGVH